MEQIFNTILSKLDAIEQNQNSIKFDINILQADINILKSDVSSTKIDAIKLQSNVSNINKKLDTIYDQTANLTEFSTETKDNLNSISEKVI
ncbi:hypothetical protein FDB55_14525 [Clostridium botulinum]|uniref:Uncharacterized protein n=2 Tax=Clostridium botulinum TaxID=1491 RepID=A0A0C2SHA2_CLOBO|nr:MULTISPECIES: hypothetical protein [Clostridium]ACD52988.1 conserved hypothetical protein [Clostridium botulinum E3 str. Alaska E43]AJF29946.1 hypothetical protein ST13_09690 [Clostridium botulinum]AJF33009.1 hypothetical protein ST12_09690 [Clostridium botulinum]EES49329.1 conserved hypothetical protein [Clostridium botulinum E1 str. 'BoNT E Beluga']KIL07428.1 hypothetical protein SR42_14740 [Clostridium botulinum]